MRTLVHFLALGSLCACSSTMTVLPVKSYPDAPGQRYSLPKPVIVVRPDAKGGGAFIVDVQYVPDDEHTYAIDAKARFSAYMLQIETENRLLKSVDWTGDATTVSTAAVEAASAVQKARFEKEQADDKKAADEKAQRKQAFEALEKDLVTKEIALAKAEATVRQLSSGGVTASDPKMIDALIAVDQARIDVEASQAALETHGAGAAFNDPYSEDASFNTIDPKYKDLTTAKVAWGPVLYALNETLDGNGDSHLELKAATFTGGSFDGMHQGLFPTASITKPKPVKKPKVTNTDGPVFILTTMTGNQGFQRIFTTNVELIVVASKTRLTRDADTSDATALVSFVAGVSGRKELHVRLDHATPGNETYTLQLEVAYKDAGGQSKKDKLNIKIQRRP